MQNQLQKKVENEMEADIYVGDYRGSLNSVYSP